MSETMANADPFEGPASDEIVGDAEEFEPAAPADPEEPETLEDDAAPPDTGEANVVDVIEQREPVGEDEDGYERED